METIRLERVKLKTRTLGSMYRNGGELLCKTLELPWLNNKRSVSCFPNGTYRVTKEPPIPPNDPSGRRERPYWHFRIHDVPGRSGILIHRIAYVKDLKGCIGVGKKFIDLDSDGELDMGGSSLALKYLVDVLPDEFMLEVVDKPS